PIVFLAALIAALSSAGLPLTFGFIGKDLIYEATLHMDDLSIWLTTLAVLTNICLVAAGFMAGIKPFTGTLPVELSSTKMPYKSMWIPPLILSFLSLLFGLFPGIVGDLISKQTAQAIWGSATDMHLAIWHGWNIIIILSLLTLGVGTILYVINKPQQSKVNFVAKFNQISPQTIITRFMNDIFLFAEKYTEVIHNGFLRSYLLKIILFAECLLIYKLLKSGPIVINFNELTPLTIYEVAVVVILIGALLIVVSTKSRLTSVVSMSVIGYCICLMFVFYSAPDLAMTQFTIDTLTTVLFVLVLYKLPGFINLASAKERYRDIIVSLGFGAILSIISLKV